VSGAEPRTAPLRRLLGAELRTVRRRPRALAALTVPALVPLVIGVGVALTDLAPGSGAALPGLVTGVSGNGLMLPITGLAVALALLLPLGVSLLAADALAGEAACGALRGQLLAPVSRPMLVGVKACGVFLVAALAVLAVALVGLVVGALALGGGGLLTLSGSTLGVGASVARAAVATGWTMLQVFAVAAVAMAVSARTEAPLVVIASVLGGAIGFAVLGAIPSLGWLRPWLLTAAWSALPDVLRDPMPTEGLARGALLAFGYLLAGLVAAVAGLLSREA
jgi:ABC-2 type transport system permease protein